MPSGVTRFGEAPEIQNVRLDGEAQECQSEVHLGAPCRQEQISLKCVQGDPISTIRAWGAYFCGISGTCNAPKPRQAILATMTTTARGRRRRPRCGRVRKIDDDDDYDNACLDDVVRDNAKSVDIGRNWAAFSRGRAEFARKGQIVARNRPPNGSRFDQRRSSFAGIQHIWADLGQILRTSARSRPILTGLGRLFRRSLGRFRPSFGGSVSTEAQTLDLNWANSDEFGQTWVGIGGIRASVDRLWAELRYAWRVRNGRSGL